MAHSFLEHSIDKDVILLREVFNEALCTNGQDFSSSIQFWQKALTKPWSGTHVDEIFSLLMHHLILKLKLLIYDVILFIIGNFNHDQFLLQANSSQNDTISKTTNASGMVFTAPKQFCAEDTFPDKSRRNQNAYVFNVN